MKTEDIATYSSWRNIRNKCYLPTNREYLN